MRKLILLLIPIILFSNKGKAQVSSEDGYSQSFPDGVNQKATNIGIYACIPEKNNAFWDIKPNILLRNELEHYPSFLKNRNANFVAINSFDTVKAQFVLHGVDTANAAQWEFRVTAWPDKIIMPWSSITKFSDELVIGAGRIAYLGAYGGKQGEWIVVDARKKGSENIATTAVVAWVSIKPEVGDVYPPDELNLFLSNLARPWRRRTPEEVDKRRTHFLNGQSRSESGELMEFIAEATENNLVFSLNSRLYYRDQLEYQLVRDSNIVIPWKPNDFDNGFVWLSNLKPGEYRLYLRYTAQREHVSSYSFMVKAPWYLSKQAYALYFSGGIFLVVFVVLIIGFLVEKKKNKTELSNKKKLQLELKMIYAQLNPHFVFNALSSIQGLINKQDINGANIYLSDFAKLMRETLTNSNSEQTPLAQETVFLDTYLKLEQLRFGFKYEIIVDEHINAYNTEIPSLLLQPLLENAVKHGVSHLDNAGIITVDIKIDGKDMIVSVADNGKGFYGNGEAKGFGLKLTRERIKLLNEFLNDQSVILEIKQNAPSGAKIYLTFKNWFL
jgi:two-component system, LytTR family, sensor kinase